MLKTMYVAIITLCVMIASCSVPKDKDCINNCAVDSIMVDSVIVDSIKVEIPVDSSILDTAK